MSAFEVGQLVTVLPSASEHAMWCGPLAKTIGLVGEIVRVDPTDSTVALRIGGLKGAWYGMQHLRLADAPATANAAPIAAMQPPVKPTPAPEFMVARPLPSDGLSTIAPSDRRHVWGAR